MSILKLQTMRPKTVGSRLAVQSWSSSHDNCC
jgi:hypothetical protein